MEFLDANYSQISAIVIDEAMSCLPSLELESSFAYDSLADVVKSSSMSSKAVNASDDVVLGVGLPDRGGF